eukprot:scaffold91906_cov48-Phaeocystis_antarctica.AAC.1
MYDLALRRGPSQLAEGRASWPKAEPAGRRRSQLTEGRGSSLSTCAHAEAMRRTVDQQPAGPPLRSEGLDGAHPVVLAAATKVDGHRRAPPLLTQLRRVHRRPRSHVDQLVPVGQHLVHGDVLVRRLGHTRHLRLGSLRAVRSR